MKDKKRLKLKKFYFHPITVFFFLTILVLILSSVFSAFEMQATYSTVNVNTKELEPTLIAVENLLNFKGIKYIISNALKNFISFRPLAILLISMIGIAIAEASGFIETFSKKYLAKVPHGILTFIILLIATASTIINDTGYAILIPLVALIYFIIGRNPILGIVTAFCGVAFGTGVTLFVGTIEISMIDLTKAASLIVDENVHISLTSNLFFISIVTFILSIIGTIVIEKLISPRIGKYKKEEPLSKTEQYNSLTIVEEEQKKIEQEKHNKKGLTASLIFTIIYILLVIYSLIPNLPGSGLLLDMSEKTYLNQVFGPKSYLLNSFTCIVSFYFAILGLTFGFNAKTIKNDKDLLKKTTEIFSKLGNIIILMFVASQFIAVFNKTNIGIVISIWLVNLLNHMNLNGFVLILISLLLISLSTLVLPSLANKWIIFSPVLVPLFMQSNISPQFAQIVMRAGDSMTKGFTPLMSSFVIFLGFLNIYNLHKDKPYTIRKTLGMISPYFIIIFISWILITIGWYILGLPIGPGVFPKI